MRGYFSDVSVNAENSAPLGAVEYLRVRETSASGSVRLTGVLADIVNEYGQTKLLVFDGIIIEIHFRSSSKKMVLLL